MFASFVVLVTPAAVTWAPMDDDQVEKGGFVRSGSDGARAWLPFPFRGTASCIPSSIVQECAPKKL